VGKRHARRAKSQSGVKFDPSVTARQRDRQWRFFCSKMMMCSAHAGCDVPLRTTTDIVSRKNGHHHHHQCEHAHEVITLFQAWFMCFYSCVFFARESSHLISRLMSHVSCLMSPDGVRSASLKSLWCCSRNIAVLCHALPAIFLRFRPRDVSVVRFVHHISMGLFSSRHDMT